MSAECYVSIPGSDEPQHISIPKGLCIGVLEIHDAARTTVVVGCNQDDDGAKAYVLPMNMIQEQITPANIASILAEFGPIKNVGLMGDFILDLVDADNQPIATVSGQHLPDPVVVH